MKSFAPIAVATLLVFASAPAFAHGGHAGMNGANNPQFTLTKNTQTQANNGWNKINNSSTKTDMTGHQSFGHGFFLHTEERILTHEISKLQVEGGRLLINGSNPTKLAHIEKELRRLRAKLFRVQIDIARQVS